MTGELTKSVVEERVSGSQVPSECPRDASEVGWRNGRLGSGTRLIFVGGAPRSGTTLLQHMLDSHQSIRGTPELLHVPDLLATQARFLKAFDNGYLDYFCDRLALKAATYGFIDRLLGPVLEDANERYVSEKTPANALMFEELYALYPQARFIFVIRDPRATISSMLRVGDRATDIDEGAPMYAFDVRTAIRTVRRYLRSGFAFARAWPDRCLIVRYEDMVSRTSKVTREICDFLCLDWDSRMLSPEEQRHAGDREISHTGVWYDSASVNRAPTIDRIESWKTELHPAKQLLVTRAFRSHSELIAEGYRLNVDHLSAYSLIQAEVGWALENAWDRIRKAPRTKALIAGFR